MTALILETAPFVRMLLTRIDAACRRVLRADGLHNWTKDFLRPYRPELHYMRGPGPRWHAKHDKA
jgi:hypothetical protein